jgi:hypothetical protein
MEDRETPQMHKYGESKNNSNYDFNCTSRDFQFGTWKISGHLIFVEQNVPKFTELTAFYCIFPLLVAIQSSMYLIKSLKK